MLSPRERQVQGLLANEALGEFEQEVAVDARTRQVQAARLDAAMLAICEQQGHAWRGRICGNCHTRWEPDDAA